MWKAAGTTLAIGSAGLFQFCSGAGSYDRVEFENMESDYRVIIGIPADSLVGNDSERIGYRRAKIIEIVEAHIEKMAETSTSLAIDSIEYAFVTSLEYAFRDIFPLHTSEGAKAAGLDTALPTPALRLTNVALDETMQPDWPILLSDLPKELDRLVADFERWQGNTDALVVDPSDGVVALHNRNLAAGLGGARHLVTLFYAPWCHYSKLMLPKFAEARTLLGQLKAAGLVEKRAVGLAKVNVDQEGDLKAKYEVATYPTLQVLSSGGNRARASRVIEEEGGAVPHAPFGGDLSSGADLASHAVCRYAWPGGNNYAILGLPGTTEGNATVPVARFAAIVSAVDGWLAAAAAAAGGEKQHGGAGSSSGSEDEDEDDDGLLAREPKRAVVVVAVFPERTSGAAVQAATASLAARMAGKNVFVAAAHGAATAGELLPLLPGAVVASKEEAEALAARAVAGKDDEKGQGGGGGGGEGFLGAHLLVAKPGDGTVLDTALSAAFVTAAAAAAAGAAAASSSASSSSSAAASSSAASAAAASASSGVAVPEAVATWAVAATWPLVSRFDPSAAQGERIRTAPVRALCVLIGDEADFMFEDFRQSLAGASRDNTGAAHFLFADKAEPRIMPLLRAAGADPDGGAPVVVVVSLDRAFAPAKLEGAAITAEAIGALLARAVGAAASSTGAKDEL